MNKEYETIISIINSDEDDGESRYFVIRYHVAAEYDTDYDEPDFIPSVSVEIREISENELDMLDDDATDRSAIGAAVCTLEGWLILSPLMQHYGFDPHYLCDAHSSDLEYCWSALSDPSISALTIFDNQGNVFYVDTIEIEQAYQPECDETGIITGLLANIIHLVNEGIGGDNNDGISYHIDTIAYYPAPLPYDDSVKQRQIDLACGIVSEIWNERVKRFLDPNSAADEPETEIKVAPELYCRAAGMRVSGDTYPEDAKNREEWDLLESAGWYECGDSRLLYRTSLDD